MAILADAVIVAAGRSQRMGGRDKLAADVAGRPLLAWSLAAIAASARVERIALVRTPEQAADARRPTWLPDKVIAIVPGGARRQDSVAAGIRALQGDGALTAGRVLLVHDGARPLVTTALIDAVVDAAGEHGAAIPVLPVAETLKRIDGERIAGNVDRNAFHGTEAQWSDFVGGSANIQIAEGAVSEGAKSVTEASWSGLPDD